MTSMSVDGLVSGLDTTSLISQLMRAEAIPQARLETTVGRTQSAVTALQSLNTRFAALATAAKGLADGTAWTTPTATSSHPSATATTTAGASPGTLTFTVDQVAQARTVISDAHAAGSVGQVIVTVDGVDHTIEPADGALPEVAKAINDLAAGVRATVVTTGPGTARLQLAAEKTGAGAVDFSLTGLGDLTTVREGTNARITLAAGVTVESPDGVFADLIPGTTVTASSRTPAGELVTLAVGVASDDVVAAMRAMVAAANAAAAEVAAKTSYDAVNRTSGPLAGNATIKSLAQRLAGAVSAAPDGTSYSTVGVEVDRYGKLVLDEDAFRAAYTDDPAAARATATTLSAALQDVSDLATESPGGVITSAIRSGESTIRDLTARIEAWDVRLALRKTTLQKQFTAMELSLSSLREQSGWLAGQIAGLPTYGNG